MSRWLTMIKSIMCQCLDLGCIHVVLYLSAILNGVLVIQSSCSAHLPEEEQIVDADFADSMMTRNIHPAKMQKALCADDCAQMVHAESDLQHIIDRGPCSILGICWQDHVTNLEAPVLWLTCNWQT